MLAVPLPVLLLAVFVFEAVRRARMFRVLRGAVGGMEVAGAAAAGLLGVPSGAKPGLGAPHHAFLHVNLSGSCMLMLHNKQVHTGVSCNLRRPLVLLSVRTGPVRERL